jgi:outer membrane protein assembly factor BamB
MSSPDSPEPSDQLGPAPGEHPGHSPRAFIGRHKRVLLGITTFVATLIAALVFLLLRAPHNVFDPKVAFIAPTTTKASKPPEPLFLWPNYGYTAARTRDFQSPSDLRPPFHVAWVRGGNALLEFPPVIDGNKLFFMDDGATVKEVNATTGEIVWAKNLGTLSSASPAIDTKTGLLYVPLLSRTGNSPGNGEFAALHMRNGKVAWTMPIAPGSESSSVVDGNAVYFGDQAGGVFAVNARTGQRIWSFQAGGPVKGGPAIAGNLLYVGDYSGQVYALNLHTGHQVWVATTSGGPLGLGSGNFYSTPAVAFGRVYIGNTNGYVYSYDATTGQLAWSTGTGAYVYSSAAVANTPGIGPTVYIGSYDGYLYAFNARSGSIRWRHYDGARISGSPSIINNVVYYSDLGKRTTTGLNARSGKVVFFLKDGAFTPMVANQQALFLSGYNALYRLDPVHKSAKKARHASASRRKVKRKS